MHPLAAVLIRVLSFGSIDWMITLAWGNHATDKLLYLASVISSFMALHPFSRTVYFKYSIFSRIDALNGRNVILYIYTRSRDGIHTYTHRQQI